MDMTNSQISTPHTSHNPNDEIIPRAEPGQKLVPIIFLTFILLLIGSVSVFAYNTFIAKTPSQKLTDSFEKLRNLKSFKASFESSGDNLKFTAETVIHTGEGQASAFNFKLTGIENDANNNLDFNMIAGQKNVYLSANYSKINELLSSLKTVMPAIEKLSTYKLLLPVISGQKYLKVSIPEVPPGQENGNQDKPTGLSDKDVKIIEKKFSETLSAHKKETVKIGDRSFDRFTFGFNKAKLIETLKTIKDSDLDIKVSQVNALIKIVESSNDWNKDLLVILIDKENGYPAEISLSLPQIDPATLKKGLSESLPEKSGLGYLKDMPFLDNLIGKVKKTELMKIGTIKFSDFDEAAEIIVPENSVSFEEVIGAAQKEIMPLIGGLMMGGGGVQNLLNLGNTPSQNNSSSNSSSNVDIQINGTSNPSGKSGSSQPLIYPTATPYPTIAPGAPGSDQWMSDFWKNWEEMGKNK